MGRSLDHDKANRTYQKQLIKGKLDVGSCTSFIQNKNMNSKLCRKSFEGRRSMRRTRAIVRNLNEERDLAITAVEDAKIKAILAEFAWKETD